MTGNPLQRPRLRLGLLLWTVGMPGVVAVTLTMLPHLPDLTAGEPLPMPLWVISLLSLGQSG
jgi:hypothetical protein